MKPASPATKSLWPLLALTALLMVLLAQPSLAATKQRVGDNFLNLYFWTSPNTWSLRTQHSNFTRRKELKPAALPICLVLNNSSLKRLSSE